MASIEKIIAREVETLRNKALQELKENKEKPLEETEAYQQFLTLTGGDKTIPLFGSDSTIDKVRDKINKSLTLKLQFIRVYIAPQIKSYQNTLSANPQIYNYLFSVFNAFTGTQWNADTFPEGLKIVSDEMITGKTLGLLWKNRNDNIQIIPPGSSKTIVQDLIAANPQAKKANVLIDTAGMIRGITRETVANQLLKTFESSRPDIKGVVFYNNENELMVLEKGKDLPILLSTSKLQPSEYFTFYDQKHTTGADIKQVSQALAIVTIGRHTLLRDLLQSVWRLRGLDKSQHVQFTVDEEVKALVFNTLKELGVPFSEPLKLEHLLLFVSYNQAQLQGDNNFRALKHKTREVLQQVMFEAFLDPKYDGNQIADLFNNLDDLFIQTTSLSPWELYGAPVSLIDSDIAAKDQANKVKESSAFEAASKISSKETITKKIDDLVKKTVPLLPQKILKNNAYGREVEAQTETETETETHKEKEVELESTTQQKAYEPSPAYPYKIVSLSETFKTAKKLEPFSDIFDPTLYGSLNFIPFDIENKVPEKFVLNTAPFELFNRYQKSICGLRILSKNEVVMVDQIDGETSDTLYDLKLGIYKAKGEVPNFLHTPEFLRKVVQAKLFNGETYYKKEELLLLQAWIKEKGVNRMRDLFVNHILKFKDESRTAFPDSILDKALT